MAILDNLPGIEVTIRAEGKPMGEYDAEDEVVRHQDEAVAAHWKRVTVTKYIESITHQVFTVNLNVKEGFRMESPSLLFEVCADGKWVRSPVMHGTRVSGLSWKFIVEGFKSEEGGIWTVQSMKFAAIATTSDDTETSIITKQSKIISKVGRIVISVYRVSEAKQHSRGGNPTSQKLSTSYDSKIHEKALKGDSKSHGIIFGTSKPCSVTKSATYTKLDGKKYPIARFEFRYRSREALQSLLIIPRGSSPSLPSLSPTCVPAFEAASQGPKPEPVKSEDQVPVLKAHDHNLAEPLTPEEQAILERLSQRKAHAEAAPIHGQRVKQESQQCPLLLATATIKRESESNMHTDSPAPRRRKKLPGKLIIDLVESDDEDREIVSID